MVNGVELAIWSWESYTAPGFAIVFYLTLKMIDSLLMLLCKVFLHVKWREQLSPTHSKLEWIGRSMHEQAFLVQCRKVLAQPALLWEWRLLLVSFSVIASYRVCACSKCPNFCFLLPLLEKLYVFPNNLKIARLS